MDVAITTGETVAKDEQLKMQIRDLHKQVARQKETIADLKGQVSALLLAEDTESGSLTGDQVQSSKLQSALVEAERANRIKSEFLESVSHEIRTSMNGIVGMTSLVLDTELTREQTQYLEMVNTSVDRLLEVVNEVLDFSKIESGVLELEQTDFNLKESLDHDLYVLKRSAENKKLSLTCEIGTDVPEVINGDSRRLVQIVTSLVSNAIKFTSTGGVEISVKHAGFDLSNRLFLLFSIRDSGVGLRHEQLEQIRSALRRSADHSLLTQEGMGMGLAVAARLVAMMDGTMGVESNSKGSVFWFTLPFREVVDIDIFEQEDVLAPSSVEESPLYALRGARILLAEDEPINRVLTEALLAQADVKSTCVNDGEQAVAEALNENYQLILMDVQMPIMDGLAATRKIRQQEKKDGRKRRPIIALTAHAMHGDREKCLQAGMDDYLTKPVDKAQLLGMLNKYLTNTALVVDGDMESRQLMVRFLVENGWNVSLAETGRSAMYEASLNHFDLILLDAQMPQVDGVEATRIIRELEHYSGQHAYILGIGQPGDQGEGPLLDCGIDGCIDRPVTREKLAAKLQQVNADW